MHWMQLKTEDDLRELHKLLGEIRSDIEAELYIQEEAANLEAIRKRAEKR